MDRFVFKDYEVLKIYKIQQKFYNQYINDRIK